MRIGSWNLKLKVLLGPANSKNSNKSLPSLSLYMSLKTSFSPSAFFVGVSEVLRHVLKFLTVWQNCKIQSVPFRCGFIYLTFSFFFFFFCFIVSAFFFWHLLVYLKDRTTRRQSNLLSTGSHSKWPQHPSTGEAQARGRSSSHIPHASSWDSSTWDSFCCLPSWH